MITIPLFNNATYRQQALPERNTMHLTLTQHALPKRWWTKAHRLNAFFLVLVASLFALVAPSANAAASCNIGYSITSQWQGGFGAALSITNTGTTALSNWTLTWNFANGQTISQLWNGNLTESGSSVTVTNLGYDGSIPAGGSVTSVGFNGTWNGATNAVPTNFALNGVACNGGVSPTGSFTLAPSAASLSIAQGASGTDTIVVTDVSPFAGAVTLAASGLPSGVTATFGTNPATGSSVVTFAASSAAAAGTSTVTITGTSGALTASTTISLTVTSSTCTPTAITPYLQVNGAGWQQASTASVASGSTVNLGPQPLSGTWSWAGPNGFTSSARQLNGIALSSGANTYVATYTNSSSCKSTQSFAITVTGSGSFTLSPSASTLSLTQATSGTDTISVKDVTPFAGSVTLAVTGLPTGVTAAFGSNPTTGSSLLTLTASNSATPGNYTITITGTSGSLTASTTIALTVTAAITANAAVTVNTSTLGIATSNQILGVNMAAWYDPTTAGVSSAFQTAGIKAVRWPGGSWSDDYDWQTNVECGNFANANATWNNFVNDLVVPAGLDVSLIANYGSDATCSGPGDPAMAAAWVANAKANSINVSHITVGNEEYGSWETDNHSSPHSASQYASLTATEFYPQIKAADSNVLVGVSVNPGNSPAWDPTVLSQATYDYVEYHYYPETPGAESDSFIVSQAAQELTSEINTIKSELATAGHASTPIYVGEIGGPYSNPGKQSWSITQGLYAGQVLGEMMNDGVTRLTWWIGFGNCNGQAGNDSASLYGWQTFGAYNVFSDGSSDTTCPNAGPIGTMSPTARAFQLFSNVAQNGQHVLTANVTGDTTNVRAYAATNTGGTALVLFNLNENSSETVSVNLAGGETSSSSVVVTTYDKTLYDQSQSDVWAAPTTDNLGAQSLPLTLTLAPWSMNVVIIK